MRRPQSPVRKAARLLVVAPLVALLVLDGVAPGEASAETVIEGMTTGPGTAVHIADLPCGGLMRAGGRLVGPLDQRPGATPPACPGPPAPAVCESPVVSAGGPYSVSSGGTVALGGSAPGTPPPSLAWAVPSSGTIENAAAAVTTFTAPVVFVVTIVDLTLVARSACGRSDTATTRVTVIAPPPPTIGDVPAISVVSGSSATLTVPGSDESATSAVPLVFTAAQQGLPALHDLTVVQVPPTGARITFTAPVLPPGQVTSSTVTLAIKAANSLGQVSNARIVKVTIAPARDRVTITGARYLASSRQLIVTARSSVTAPELLLTLRPYVTRAGHTFVPTASTFVNRGNGRYTLTLAGVPNPAAGKPLRVVSSLGGRSPAHAVRRVRP